MSLRSKGTNIFHSLGAELDSFLQRHPTGYFPFDAAKGVDYDITNQPLERNGYLDDTMDDSDDELEEWPHPPPPGMLDPEVLDEDVLEDQLVLMRGRGMLSQTRLLRVAVRGHTHPRRIRLMSQDLKFARSAIILPQLRQLIAAVGPPLMARATDEVETIGQKGIISFG